MTSATRHLSSQEYRNYLIHDPKYIKAKQDVTRTYTWIGRLDAWAGDNLLKKICVVAAYIFAATRDYIKSDDIAHKIYWQTLQSHERNLNHSEQFNGIALRQSALYCGSSDDVEKAALAVSLASNFSHSYLEEEARKHIQQQYGLENVTLTPIHDDENSKHIQAENIKFTRNYIINIQNTNGKLVELGQLTLKATFDHRHEEADLEFECSHWNQPALEAAQKVSDRFEDLPPISGDTLRKQWGGIIPPKERMLAHLAKSHIESQYNIQCRLGEIHYAKTTYEETGESYDLAYEKHRDFSCDILDTRGNKIGTYTSNSTFSYEPGVGKEIPAGAEIPIDKVSLAPLGPDGALVPILPGSEKLNYAKVEFNVTFDNRAELTRLQTELRELRDRQINQFVYDLIGAV